MSSLVNIPWQPGFKVTPRLLVRLQVASHLAGHNIIVDDAWRDFEEQLYYWNRYVAKTPGWTIASNPNDPKAQNNHLRGEAVDIVNQSDRKFMLAAGFTADANEWWHFNDPDWASMPIIKVDDSATMFNAISAQPIMTIPIVEYDMNSLVTYGPKFVVIDHIAKKLRVIEDVVSTEYNILVNTKALIEKQGGKLSDLSDNGWADLISPKRGYVRIWDKVE